MLAYTEPNNDIYFFFENDEIDRLEKGKVNGIYFNRKNPEITCPLEVTVEKNMSNFAIINVKGDDEGFVTWMHLQIRAKKYLELKEDKSADIHEGYRHICFRNASDIYSLYPLEQLNYNTLKKWASEINPLPNKGQ